MKEFKHTNGEWEVFDVAGALGVTTPQADVAWCNDEGDSFHSIRPREEDIANAYLIAAAPNLKAAAEAMIKAFDTEGGGRSTDMHTAMTTLREAVLKSKMPCPCCEWKVSHDIDCTEAEEQS